MYVLYALYHVCNNLRACNSLICVCSCIKSLDLADIKVNEFCDVTCTFIKLLLLLQRPPQNTTKPNEAEVKRSKKETQFMHISFQRTHFASLQIFLLFRRRFLHPAPHPLNTAKFHSCEC